MREVSWLVLTWMQSFQRETLAIWKRHDQGDWLPLSTLLSVLFPEAGTTEVRILHVYLSSKARKICCCFCLGLSLESSVLHLRGSNVPQSTSKLSVSPLISYRMHLHSWAALINRLIPCIWWKPLFQGFTTSHGLESAAFWCSEVRSIALYGCFIDWTHKVFTSSPPHSGSALIYYCLCIFCHVPVALWGRHAVQQDTCQLYGWTALNWPLLLLSHSYSSLYESGVGIYSVNVLPQALLTERQFGVAEPFGQWRNRYAHT